jgi:hypothetical protein
MAVQFTDKDGMSQRYCADCWNKKCKADDTAAEARMPDSPAEPQQGQEARE